MKKTAKKIIALAMALIMLGGFIGGIGLDNLAIIANAADARKDNPSFTKAYWKYYDDGEICFTGDIIALSESGSAPWTDKEGVDISGNITSITISNTVKSIGANGFLNIKVGVIGIPKTVTSIDAKAFQNSSITTIYYEGSETEWNSIISGDITERTIFFDHIHSGQVLKHGFEANCSAIGYEGDKYCSLCGSFYANGKTIEKTGHKWSTDKAYIDGRVETCNKDGERAKYCVYCGIFDYTTKEIVPSDPEKHIWIVQEEDKVNECFSYFGGTPDLDHIVMHCSECGKSSEDYRDLRYLDKNKKVVATEKPGPASNPQESPVWKTLTKAQQNSIVNRDDVLYNLSIIDLTAFKNDHHYSYATTDPTCTEDGTVIVSCDWCKNYHDHYSLPATGHSDVSEHDVLEVIKQPSCPNQVPEGSAATGLRQTICKTCGKVLSTEIIPDNHTPGYYSGTWVTQKEQTCVQDGYQWLACNYCGEYLKDADGDYIQNTLQKTPTIHTESRWFKVKEATCTDTGEEVKICTNKGCPYYSDTAIGTEAIKISDRKAIDTLKAVTKDTNKEHFDYGNTNFTEDEKVYDVTNEVNMAILSSYQSKGSAEDLKDAIITVFTTAVSYHGETVEDKDGETFKFDEDNYGVNEAGNPVKCVEEDITDADKTCVYVDDNNQKFAVARIVFSEIVDRVADMLIEKESVINTIDEVLQMLENAWLEIGTEEMMDVVNDNPDLIAKITDKALKKKEIAALGHNYVRCAYILVNNEFIPVAERTEGEGKWYRIASYVYDEVEDVYTPVASDKDEDFVPGDAVTIVNCLNGGGNMVYQCTRCLELGETTLVKPGSHDLKTKHFEPTCYENGFDREYCTKCDYYVDKETEIKLTHNYVETTIKEATCSKAGIKVKICTYCGDVDKSTYQTLATLPHSDSPVNEAATCTEKGREGMVCSVCGRFEGTILPALGHAYKDEVVAPTCTELGYTVAKCTRCGDAKAPEKFVAVTGHQYGKAVYVAATCTEGSYIKEECKVCDYKKIYNQKDNALGHNMVTVPAVDATCTEPGRTEKIYCSRPGCDYVQKESQNTPALGHKPKTVAYKAPTCTEDGNEQYTVCTVCGTETDVKVVIPALGHDMEKIPAVAATCTKNGNTEGTKCKRCGKYGVEPQVIYADKSKHSDQDGDKVCDICGCITKAIRLNVPANAEVYYNSKLTIKGNVSDIPDGFRLVILEGNNQKASTYGKDISYEYGKIKSGTTFTFKVVDEYGNTAKNNDGSSLERSVTVSVNASLIRRIVAFFRYLFGRNNTVVLEP